MTKNSGNKDKIRYPGLKKPLIRLLIVISLLAFPIAGNLSLRTMAAITSYSEIKIQEEVTPTPTEEVTPTPTEEVTPTPTVEITPTPTPAVEPEPDYITSYICYVDSISMQISRVRSGLTVNQFLEMLNERDYIRIFSGLDEITGFQTVGTGMTVVLMHGYEIIKSYTVVVTGDVNGDGKITLTDFVQMQSHLLHKTLLDGFYLQAADLNGGGVTITDFVMMQSHLLGNDLIVPRIH